jgi:hypothetical protein
MPPDLVLMLFHRPSVWLFCARSRDLGQALLRMRDFLKRGYPVCGVVVSRTLSRKAYRTLRWLNGGSVEMLMALYHTSPSFSAQSGQMTRLPCTPSGAGTAVNHSSDWRPLQSDGSRRMASVILTGSRTSNTRGGETKP